ncbi:MAG TPA: hypothetical protein VK712_00920, partial [Verrucomicrobiae bacterium]|nr:hypothetical protein [Verrucomicrobiae bacterium]
SRVKENRLTTTVGSVIKKSKRESLPALNILMNMKNISDVKSANGVIVRATKSRTPDLRCTGLPDVRPFTTIQKALIILKPK